MTTRSQSDTAGGLVEPPVPPLPESSFSESDIDTIPAIDDTSSCTSDHDGSADHSGSTSTCCAVNRARAVKTKYSHKNSLEEKRRMRRERVRRKRSKSEKNWKLESDVDTERHLRKCAEEVAFTYKNMSRTYWEWWRWELHKRREAMVSELQARNLTARIHSRGIRTVATSDRYLAREIDDTVLRDPIVNGEASEEFVGRGYFGVVRVQLYRGIQVAVKEYLPKSVVADVMHEASILASLCHPYLPLLYGVCTQQHPLRIVMLFHAFEGLQSSTIRQEVQNHHFSGHAWILLCAQLLEALMYLHEEVHVLHNDLKADNVLVAQSLVLTKENYQVVVIDFGKARKISETKRYHLSELEKREYICRYPQLAPEVIEGETRQSTFSDMFSFGKN